MSGLVCSLVEKAKQKVKQVIDAVSPTPINKLKKTLKKQEVLLEAYKKMASQQVEEKEKFESAGDIVAASRCSKLQWQYERLIKKLENSQFHIKLLMADLEEVKAKAETVEAIESGEEELKKLLKMPNINDENKLMRRIDGLMTSSEQIQDPFSITPSVAIDSNEAEMAV